MVTSGSNGLLPRQTPERRARIMSGLPRPVDQRKSWWLRALTNPWVWLGVLMVVSDLVVLWRMHHMLVQPIHVDATHIVPGLNDEAFKEAARLAARTAGVWILVFLLLDRLRRLPVWMYVIALLWGSCMATWLSLNLNDFFGAMMQVRGAGSPGAGARPAIFSAPFVEESAKATIVFLLVVFARNRVSSILQSVTLAGMSAIGFAFTENIVYYARARVYASYTQQAGDADAAVHQLFLTRGVYTSFGHMTFTSMTAIGLGIAVRTRSKLVRVLAPMAGFVLAATLHMMFNGTSTVMQTHAQEIQFYIVGWSLVAGMAGFLITQLFREKRRIRYRLTDFVRMGWLSPRDPIVQSSVWRRAWLLIVGMRRGWRTFQATRRRIRDLTELAYTRDAMVRGVVDEAGLERCKALLGEITALRPVALCDTQGLRLDIPWHKAKFWERRHRPDPVNGWGAPAGSPALGAASAPGQWPAPGPQWPARG